MELVKNIFTSIFGKSTKQQSGPFTQPTKPANPRVVNWSCCLHPNHRPPMYLYVRPGEAYEHICPQCHALILVGG